MSYCWRFIVSKKRLQCKSTKIPYGYWRQANLFVSITIRTNLPDILLPMRLRNGLSFSKIAIFHFVKKKGKIFAQPYPTKCIQFLDRENNDKNNTLPLGKQICSLRQCIVFVTVFSIQELNASCRMGLCGNFTRNETDYIPVCKYWSERQCNDYSKTSLNSFFSFWSSSKVIEVSKKRKHHLRGKHQIVYIPPRNHLREGWLHWTNCEAY